MLLRLSVWQPRLDSPAFYESLDHLGHLGYQPTFYRVQDVIFTNNSNYGWHFMSMF